VLVELRIVPDCYLLGVTAQVDVDYTFHANQIDHVISPMLSNSNGICPVPHYLLIKEPDGLWYNISDPLVLTHSL
jgi:hypothetical protein